MRTLSSTEAVTILLEGDIERPTERDWERITPIIADLKAKHEARKAS